MLPGRIPLPALHQLVGGFRPGRLYALCAAANASPAPLALTLAHRLAVEAEVPVAYLCTASARAPPPRRNSSASGSMQFATNPSIC